MIKRIVNHIISTLKGFDYKIDDRIPSGYLVSLIMGRLIMLVNGYLSRIDHGGMLFLSPSARVKARTRLKTGKGVTIGPYTYIDALSANGIRLGNNVSLGRNTRIEGTGNLKCIGRGLIAKDNVGLGSDCFYGCAGGIEIGQDTIIGNFVSFHSENHLFSNPDVPVRLQGVSHHGIYVGRDCWIGAKTTVLDGAYIEQGCIIAAGSVVKAGRYKAYGVYAGVPAKLVKWRKEAITHAE